MPQRSTRDPTSVSVAGVKYPDVVRSSGVIAAALLGVCALSSCSKDEGKKAPAPAPKQPALSGKCPAATTIAALDSSTDISASGPFDLATFTIAKAQLSGDGTKLQVFIANKDWSIDRLSSMPSPVENAGEAYVTVTFKAKDAAAMIGAYSPKNHDAPPDREVSTSLVVKGNALGVSLGDSKAEVIDMTGARVCGSFDLFGESEFEGKKTHLAGTFVADL